MDRSVTKISILLFQKTRAGVSERIINVSILCVMVIVATDGSGEVFSLHAEADDVEERARSFIITRRWEAIHLTSTLK